MAQSNLDDGDDLNSSINITPLVDIFLVLLIIFMITSSVSEESQFDLELPRAAHAAEKASRAAGLIVDRQARLYLEGVRMDSAALSRELVKRSGEDPELQVLIGADQELAYREVVRAIDLVKGSGIKRYALKLTSAGL